MIIKDRIVVVTGGAGGIGAALCRRFAREGAKAVVCADMDGDAANRLAAEIGHTAFRCDAARESDIVNLIDYTEQTIGPIDLFCSNAGIMVKGGVDVQNDDWQRIWEVNVMSHVYAARALVDRMANRGGGCFVITASAAGLLSQIGSTPYSATKHAAVGLAENLAITYGEKNIRVSVICPQAVATAMTREGGGVAAVDGLIEADKVADDAIDGIAEERFLILPHPEVAEYMRRKTADYDRWLSGMRRLQRRFL